MRFILFYETIEREFQNALLLKAELKKRGHSLLICDPYYMINISKEKFDFIPDVLLTPFLYEDGQLKIFKDLFNGKLKRIVNLQYEQILTNHHNKIGLHIPKNLNRNAIHLCWGEKWRNVLISNGVPKENCIVTGSINVDMDRERFDGIYKTKEDMAKEYNLDKNKKWIIFISSFSMVNLTDTRIDFHINRFGKEKVQERMKVDTESREIILSWIKRYIKENECEFIYRPHPGEAMDNYIYKIQDKYDNFHIIKNDSIRGWIKVCDKIHTWASTSIVDIYFMKKNCSILRPVELPEFINNGLLDNGEFIRDYDEFCEYNNNEIIKFPIDEKLILENFYIDENKYAYEIICDLLEDIVKKDLIMELYNN